MKKSEYICDICGAKTTTDEINSGKTISNKIYGLYYACDATRWEKRAPWDCSHHICFNCIQAICNIAKEEKLI